ncbi:hypothetical protein [Bifidobacterium sp. ESL0790]|uniref:hypothetical protein n=1 Tax=Bifidobacterium sp. ESL0790 TaxID=2983233 RepID=UPI0023F9AC64|nr:hypothetical protein [Bifidobacterium sp. ESL0790]WEV72252.1 hypothetical protein OZY47_07425 [Bifidobacterium sp. ESL0790]
MTLNEEEICEMLGMTREEMDECIEAAENGTFHVDPDSIVQVRPMTSEMQESINRAWDYWDAKDAEEAKKRVATATA